MPGDGHPSLLIKLKGIVAVRKKNSELNIFRSHFPRRVLFSGSITPEKSNTLLICTVTTHKHLAISLPRGIPASMPQLERLDCTSHVKIEFWFPFKIPDPVLCHIYQTDNFL